MDNSDPKNMSVSKNKDVSRVTNESWTLRLSAIAGGVLLLLLFFLLFLFSEGISGGGGYGIVAAVIVVFYTSLAMCLISLVLAFIGILYGIYSLRNAKDPAAKLGIFFNAVVFLLALIPIVWGIHFFGII